MSLEFLLCPSSVVGPGSREGEQKDMVSVPTEFII